MSADINTGNSSPTDKGTPTGPRASSRTRAKMATVKLPAPGIPPLLIPMMKDPTAKRVQCVLLSSSMRNQIISFGNGFGKGSGRDQKGFPNDFFLIRWICGAGGKDLGLGRK